MWTLLTYANGIMGIRAEVIVAKELLATYRPERRLANSADKRGLAFAVALFKHTARG